MHSSGGDRALVGAPLLHDCSLCSVIHHVVRHQSAERNEEATRWHMENSDGDDRAVACLILVYFFFFAAGIHLCALAGVRWVHPVQIWRVQLIGSAVIVACVVLFIVVHVDLSENWSPQPERKARSRHQLVTHGVFRWARHPHECCVRVGQHSATCWRP